MNKEQRILHKNKLIMQSVLHLDSIVSKMSREKMIESLDKVRNEIVNTKTTYSTSTNLYNKHAPLVIAIVREVCSRIRSEKHFESQILATLCLNDCCIIEMKTGQGKTLAAIPSAVLRSLWKEKVLIVTANDYLAFRDFREMKAVYDYLEIKTGYVVKDLSDCEKKDQYKADVVYVSSHEIGFDYLRSNMKYRIDEVMLFPEDFKHIILDEADSILIDTARIPFVIGNDDTEQDNDDFVLAARVIFDLDPDFVEVNMSEKDAFIKPEHIDDLEDLICFHYVIDKENIYSKKNIYIMFYIDRALKAKYIFRKNYEYVIIDSKICLVDEYTGRTADDRKFSNGIHQAIEAKEGVEITTENIQVNYITVQNLYRKFKYISGMTGTIYTEKKEIEVIYNVNVVRIPRQEKNNTTENKPVFFKTKEKKFQAIARLVLSKYNNNQPVLIGTSSIHESEEIAYYLDKLNLPYRILNARNLTEEADIISDSGIPRNITISTNIAGRGTDIKLGGNPQKKIDMSIKKYGKMTEYERKYIEKTIKQQFKKLYHEANDAGGLVVIITQLQENRRIDNQFRGRTGRRSDKGEIYTFVSLEDDLFINTKSNTRAAVVLIDNNESGTQSFLLNKMVQNLQTKLEQNMFDSRISVINQDHMVDKSRDSVFKLRNQILCKKIDYVVSIKKMVSSFKFLFSENIDLFISKFLEIFPQHKSIIKILNKRSMLKYLEKQIFGIPSDFFEQNMEEITMEMLKKIDEIWSDFINTKEVIKRAKVFITQVDYILDYNTKLCDLFEKIFEKYDTIVLRSIFYIYSKNRQCLTKN